MNMQNRTKKYIQLSLTLVLATTLSACLSTPSKPKANNPTPVAKPEPKPIKPNDPADPKPPGGPVDTTPELKALNLPAPKAGSFLQANFEHNPDDAPIVKLSDGKLYYDYEKSQTRYKTPMVSGIHKVLYKDGKIIAMIMGHGRFYPKGHKYEKFNLRFSDRLDGNKRLRHFTASASQKIKDAVKDVGLLEGGKKAGVYMKEDSSYIWRDPVVAGWNYQTFGYFKQKIKKGGKTFDGYQSIGVGTTTAQLPTEGKASYNGYSTGLYQVSGKVHDTIADVKVDVNFGKREVKFSTLNTKTYERKYTGPSTQKKYTLGKAQSAQQLNLKATANFNKGSTKFSTTKVGAFGDDDLKGRLDGRFYGDKAAEVGGTFGLEGNGKNYMGGFGAKRK